MSQIILLDAGPLGLVTNPKRSEKSVAAAQWLQTKLRQGDLIIVPEIADYEVRRELLRANKVAGVQRLDALIDGLSSLPGLRINDVLRARSQNTSADVTVWTRKT